MLPHSDINVDVKREVCYQVMRTMRFPFGMLFYPVVIFLAIYIIYSAVNLFDLFCCGMHGVLSHFYGPPSAMGGKYLSDTLECTVNSCAPIRTKVMHDAWRMGILGLIAATCYGISLPYMDRPNMPTSKIRVCRHCGARLPNHVFLLCGECRRPFPSGYALAIIRTYGYALTIISFMVLGIMMIVF